MPVLKPAVRPVLTPAAVRSLLGAVVRPVTR